MKKLILLLIAFVLPTAAQSQWALLKHDADKLVLQGLDHIYNVQFDSASVAFNKVIEMYPEHPAGYFGIPGLLVETTA